MTYGDDTLASFLALVACKKLNTYNLALVTGTSKNLVLESMTH